MIKSAVRKSKPKRWHKWESVNIDGNRLFTIIVFNPANPKFGLSATEENFVVMARTISQALKIAKQLFEVELGCKLGRCSMLRVLHRTK